MNERIKTLIERSNIKFEAHPQHQGIDTAVIIQSDLEKFAELIVKECIAKITLEQDSADQNWQCKNGVHIAYELQEHFGVQQ